MDKEIIVLLAVVVVAILAAAFTSWAAYKRDLHFIYVHTKTGNRYRVIQECKMKYDGKWMDAIAYISEKDNEIYVRKYDDFVLNFKRLSEWKEN
jgi:hypothetical protein